MSRDVEDLVRRWREDAREDMELARDISTREKHRHAMFFAHLALEKALKALVMRATGRPAPKIHNLPELASRTAVSFDEEQMEFLATMNFYQLAGRYLNSRDGRVDPDRAAQNFGQAERLFEWLIRL